MCCDVIITVPILHYHHYLYSERYAYMSFFFNLVLQCYDFSGRLPDSGELLQKEELVRLKRCIYALQRNGLPPVTTHNVVDDWNDAVLGAVRRCNLFNTTYDRVKVSI